MKFRCGPQVENHYLTSPELNWKTKGGGSMGNIGSCLNERRGRTRALRASRSSLIRMSETEEKKERAENKEENQREQTSHGSRDF